MELSSFRFSRFFGSFHLLFMDIFCYSYFWNKSLVILIHFSRVVLRFILGLFLDLFLSCSWILSGSILKFLLRFVFGFILRVKSGFILRFKPGFILRFILEIFDNFYYLFFCLQMLGERILVVKE